MTPYQIIAMALQRAKNRRKNKLSSDLPTTKCCKCNSPCTKNRFGTPIIVCEAHYKEALKNKLCSNCYDSPKHQSQCYCLPCKRDKDNQRPKRVRNKHH